MKPKDKFSMALEGKQPPGRVPHFELVFYLTMEAFRKVHPDHRQFDQWDQMSETEKDLQRTDIAETYIKIARRYEHSAIFFQCADIWQEKININTLKILDLIQKKTNDEYLLMIHGDRTWGLPEGNEMMDFIIDEKGQEVISERHQKDFKKTDFSENGSHESSGSTFTDVDFDDI